MDEKLKLEIEQLLSSFNHEEMEARALQAAADTKAAVEAAPEGTQFYTQADIERLAAAARNGDHSAIELLTAFYENEETRDLLETITELKRFAGTEDELRALVEDFKNRREQRVGYRTAAKAGQVVKNYPTAVAAVTLSNYDNAISLYENGNAYLAPLPGTDGLKFEDGKMYFEGSLAPISEAQLQNMKTKESISTIDLPLLRSFYSILLAETQKNQKKLDIVSLYVPDLAAYLGKPRNLNEERIQSIIVDVQKFHNIVGLIKTPWGDSIFPVLNFEGYDKETNTISFSSPYMNYLINKLQELTVRKDSKGKPKLKKNNEPLRLPSHSYAIKSDIVKERNKNAVENVFIIVTTIEQAGNNTPHLAASTIVERNPQLKQALESSANPTQLLSRCFKKTWELLRSKTYLEDMYKDIELPNPNDPAAIPTASNLSKMVFRFPHKGKKKK